MKYNLFSGNEIYSFNDDLRQIIIKHIAEPIADAEFMIDDKAMEMMGMLGNCTFKLGKTLVMKSDKGRYTAKLLDKPFNKPVLKPEFSVELDFNTIITANDFTAKNGKMPMLTGVFVADNGNIYSSDGYTAYRHKVNDDYTGEGITIPNDFISFLQANIKTDKITLNCERNKCYITDGDTTYIGHLLDGRYPNVEKIYADLKPVCDINYNHEFIKNYLTFANKCGGDVIYLDFNNSSIKTLGNNDYELECKQDNDFGFRITLDYFNKVFNKVDDVNIEYCGELRPILINNQFIILPVRVGD